jgi:hypothetical protein
MTTDNFNSASVSELEVAGDHCERPQERGNLFAFYLPYTISPRNNMLSIIRSTI